MKKRLLATILALALALSLLPGAALAEGEAAGRLYQKGTITPDEAITDFSVTVLIQTGEVINSITLNESKLAIVDQTDEAKTYSADITKAAKDTDDGTQWLLTLDTANLTLPAGTYSMSTSFTAEIVEKTTNEEGTETETAVTKTVTAAGILSVSAPDPSKILKSYDIQSGEPVINGTTATWSGVKLINMKNEADTAFSGAITGMFSGTSSAGYTVTDAGNLVSVTATDGVAAVGNIVVSYTSADDMKNPVITFTFEGISAEHTFTGVESTENPPVSTTPTLSAGTIAVTAGETYTEENPGTIAVSIKDAAFGAEEAVTNIANWDVTFVEDVGLTLSKIELVDNTNAKLYFTGTAKAGTIKIKVKQAAYTGSQANTSNEVSVAVNESKPVETGLSRKEVAVLLNQYAKPAAGDVSTLPADCAGLTSSEKSAIAAVIKAGWMVGFADGSFGPDRIVTRAEMAVLICSALGIEEPNAGTITEVFSDLPEWCAPYIGELYTRKIITAADGNNGQFGATANIVKADAEKWLKAAFPTSTTPTPTPTPGTNTGNSNSGSSGSSSGSSSSGSSSGGGSYTPPASTTTATTKNPDGSTTTKTENKNTGAVTETTKYADGSQTVVETKKDGTVTTTMRASNGSTSTTTVDASGKTQVTAKLPATAASTAQVRGEAVPVNMPEVSATRNSSSAPTVTVNTGVKGPVTVEIPVRNADTGTVAVIVHADGSEEVAKTSLTTVNGVAVSVSDGDTVKIVDNTKSFNDTRSHWASEAINFVTSREIFSGTGDNAFSPNSTMTRAMLVTALAKYEGVNVSGGSVWYEKGLNWARQNGISDGSNPNGEITREQLATMLYNYAGRPNDSGLQIIGFRDADQISSYAQAAMSWAVQNGLISGMGDGTLNPRGTATRAQVTSIMMNFCKNIAK